MRADTNDGRMSCEVSLNRLFISNVTRIRLNPGLSSDSL